MFVKNRTNKPYNFVKTAVTKDSFTYPLKQAKMNEGS